MPRGQRGGQSGGSKVRAEGDTEGNGKYSSSGYILKVELPGFIGYIGCGV